MDDYSADATQTRRLAGRRRGTPDAASAREDVNRLCAACLRACKQAGFCMVVACPKYRPAGDAGKDQR